MSIICYFVNMESFAGNTRRRRRRRRRWRRKNKISNASINASINAQDVTILVKAIQFVKKSPSDELTINEFSVTTTDKEIIKYDGSYSDLIKLENNKYTFDTPQKIKVVSFTSNSGYDILKDVMMNFLDSSDTIINQILMPEQVETKFTFILPPYSEEYTIAQLYSQKIKNARAIADALINADKLMKAKDNARIITDVIANAQKNVTDISLNITSINKQISDNSGNITKYEESLKVSSVRFSKNYSEIVYNDEYKDAVNSLTSAQSTASTATRGYVQNVSKSIATFAISVLLISTKKLPSDNTTADTYNIQSTDLAQSLTNFSDIISAPTDTNNINTIKINFKLPRIITNISFNNGSDTAYLARLTGVKMQFLNASDSVLNEIILSSTNAPYNLKFPASYTPDSALARTQSEIDKIIANNQNLKTMRSAKETELGIAQIGSQELTPGTATYKLSIAKSDDKETKSLTEVYIQGYKAISSALEQVKTASKSLNNALNYDIYINDYVSTNYINLVEEQQKKMLSQALLYAKKARSAIFNLLDQTKLTLSKITLFGLAGTYSSTATLSVNETSYNKLSATPIVRHNFRLNMLIDIQDLAKNELTTLSSSIISADTLLKSLLNPPTK